MNEAGAARSNASKKAESIVARLKKTTSAVALAIMSSATAAQAESIIFNFNCVIVNATTCTPVPQLAVMTLSDSTLNRNHVNMDVQVSSQVEFTSLNKLFLNYSGATWIEGGYFSLTRQDSWIGFGQEDFNTVLLDRVGPYGGGMDIALGLPESMLRSMRVQSPDLRTVSAGLVFRNDLGPYGEGDLDAAAFQTRDVNNLVYAALEMSTSSGVVYAGASVAYRPSDVLVIPISESTSPAGGGSGNQPPPPNVSQFSGTLIQAAVAEPGTLALLGFGAAFLGWAIRCKKQTHA
jgi:hypothetical protein